MSLTPTEAVRVRCRDFAKRYRISGRVEPHENTFQSVTYEIVTNDVDGISRQVAEPGLVSDDRRAILRGML